jgi:hypothetical protein
LDFIDFSILFQKDSGCSLPVLIELKHPEKETWYFTSNDQDIEWQGELYLAVPMSYKFPASRDGVPQGGVLEIDLDQQREIQGGEYEELLKWFDEADYTASIDVVALINKEGNVTPISQITQRHGTVTWDGVKISWNTASEIRLGMQVNAWIFDGDALTG